MIKEKSSRKIWYQRKIEDLEMENAYLKGKYEDGGSKVIEALEFYASADNWAERGSFKRYRHVDKDKGKLAKEALKCVER